MQPFTAEGSSALAAAATALAAGIVANRHLRIEIWVSALDRAHGYSAEQQFLSISTGTRLNCMFASEVCDVAIR